jgi:pimeloyl-ACP methyl ester carboxylesterase
LSRHTNITRDAAAAPAYEPATGELRLPDDRILTYCLYGPEDGEPVLFQFGTPGTRFLAPDRISVIEAIGVRLLVADRPGYGGSTRLKGRNVAQVAADVTALVDRLGWERFAVWGGSGGAPHALGCAAQLGDRVTRCASVVGPAPFDAVGLDWFDGMSPGNVEEFTRARSGEAAYRPLVEQLARDAVTAVEKGDLPVADNYELADADRAALAEQFNAPGHLFRTRTAYTGGIDGWIDDGIAFTREWSFDISRICAPVSIWYGPDDALCPRGHTDWLLNHISGAEAHVLPGGHLLDTSSLQRLYRWLVT